MRADPLPGELSRLRRLRRVLAWRDRLERHRFDRALASDDAAIARVDALEARLDDECGATYGAIRDAIRRGGGRYDLLPWLRRGAGDGADALDDGYDHRDEILAGVLRLAEPGATRVAPSPEMVFYQPTPARHIVELLERVALREDDVLVDLGSGLGHVSIVAAMCTGARAVGIEIEPAYVAVAREAAGALGVRRAEFVEADARGVTFDDGTVFHLYTPFGGAMLRVVLDALREQARVREIRISTLGPCAPVVAAEPWLAADGAVRIGNVSIFRSRE